MTEHIDWNYMFANVNLEDDAVEYEWGQRTNSFEWTIAWLKQPAE